MVLALLVIKFSLVLILNSLDLGHLDPAIVENHPDSIGTTKSVIHPLYDEWNISNGRPKWEKQSVANND